ncbi:MAG: LysR family transcriptional regulator [Pseudorhodobacter sp.]|nr:LysR family transcriptional regulator [Pseudorhodobacter sp.]
MNLSAFDLNLLKVLDALLRQRSTVKAGDRVGLSQPAVLSALGRLRLAFGDPLLVRDGQRMRPTEFALSLAQILEDSGRLPNPARFDPATAEHTVRITASDFFTKMMLPDLMARLERLSTGIALRYADAPNPQSMEELRDGRVDLCLLPEIAFASWAEWRPAVHAAYVLIARQDHPDLRAAGVTTAQAMPVELYCRLRHAAFRVIEAQPEHQAMSLSALSLERRVILSVPTFAAV